MEHNPTLAELGIDGHLAEMLTDAGLTTAAAILADREANGDLTHINGIGDVLDLEVVAAIADYEAAADEPDTAEPIADEPDTADVSPPVPAEAVADEPAPEAEIVAEEPDTADMLPPTPAPEAEPVAEEPDTADMSPPVPAEAVADEPSARVVELEAALEDANEAINQITDKLGERVNAEAKLRETLEQRIVQISQLQSSLAEQVERTTKQTNRASELETAEEKLREENDRLTGELQAEIARFQSDDDADSPPIGQTCVRLVRQARIRGAKYKPGTLLARVSLAPNVSLNYLVDAVRNDLAKER